MSASRGSVQGRLGRRALRAALARRAGSLRTYLICSTHRTGSTLLCQLLTDTGLCGAPDEYWSPRWAPRFAERIAGERTDSDDSPPARPFHEIDFRRYLLGLFDAKSTPNGSWGCNVQWPHVRRIHEALDPRKQSTGVQTLRLLGQVYDQPRYVWLRRRDKVRQAISFWRSKQTKVFSSTGPVEESLRPEFDYEKIDGFVRRFEEQDACWQRLFREGGVEPFSIEFESFVEHKAETLAALLEYLEIEHPAEIPLPEPRLKKISDGLNDAWYERYRERRRTDGD